MKRKAEDQTPGIVGLQKTGISLDNYISLFLASDDISKAASTSTAFQHLPTTSKQRDCSHLNEGQREYYHFSLPIGQKCPFYAEERIFSVNQICARMHLGLDWPGYLHRCFHKRIDREFQDDIIEQICDTYTTGNDFGRLCRILFEYGADNYVFDFDFSFMEVLKELDHDFILTMLLHGFSPLIIEHAIVRHVRNHPNVIESIMAFIQWKVGPHDIVYLLNASHHVDAYFLMALMRAGVTVREIDEHLRPFLDRVPHSLLLGLIQNNLKASSIVDIVSILDDIDHWFLLELVKRDISPRQIQDNILPIQHQIDHGLILHLLDYDGMKVSEMLYVPAIFGSTESRFPS